MRLFDRLEEARRRHDVLQHPFYVRWSNGELTGEELAFYAGEYRHAVVALADAVAAAARGAAPEAEAELREHAAEEAAHVELWDRFAAAVGAERSRLPLAETLVCAGAWTAGREGLEALVAAWTVESGQPAIARTKLDGLTRHYGMEEGPATAYFTLHSELDVEHAASARRLIEDWAAQGDEDRLAERGEAVLRGNWELLDGVERAFGRRPSG